MDLSKKLTINEIFYSIQGESYLTGLPYIFIRLTGCHQRCVYCDTEYAFYDGNKISIEDILSKISTFTCNNVLVTGGEPLLQSNCGVLCEVLLDKGYRVSLETSGNLDIRKVPNQVIKIMDLKTPSSGELSRNNYQNIDFLEKKDEVKIVISDQNDLNWAFEIVKKYNLTEICHVSYSTTQQEFLSTIADAILQNNLNIRLQIQFHKLIWPQKLKGY